MDSKGPNFTAAETRALLDGVRCHYASIVGSCVAGGAVTNKTKKEVWVEITRNVNATRCGQRRTLDQVKFRWKNLRAKATKDAAEAANPQTGNKPFRKGEYTDVVLDIIGHENVTALRRTPGVLGDPETTFREDGEQVPANFTAAETHALLEGVRCHYASILGSCVAMTNKKKKDIWVEITQNVNATGSGYRRTLDQVKFRWKNLRARATRDAAEVTNPQTGYRPFRKGEYTDLVLDIIAGESSKALQMFQVVVADGEPVVKEDGDADAEDSYCLDLSPFTEEQPGSSLEEPAGQHRGLKRPLSSNDDDDHDLLLRRETERAEVQTVLAREQIKLTRLQQTKTRLQISLLKVGLRKAGLSSLDIELLDM